MAGGQQVVLRSIARLDRSRVECHVCYFRPPAELASQFVKAGVTPRLIEHRGWWSTPRVLAQLVKTIRLHRIDAVHVHGTPVDKFYGQAAALVCGLPVVRTIHGMKPPRPSLRDLLRRPRPRFAFRWVRQIRQAVLDRVMDRWTVRRVVTVSEAVFESWAAYLKSLGISADQITVSYNGVPVDEYAGLRPPEELHNLRRALGIEDAFPVLINVGRLSPGKGQDLLVPMLQTLLRSWPKAKLLIVGEGEYRPGLQERIDQSGLNGRIQLLGCRADVPALLSVSDVFVFSSHFEGFPLSVLEAMASATPVVSFELPGLSQLIQEGINGYLVRQRSPELLARFVGKAIEDPERARQMGREAQSLVKDRYDVGHSVKALETVYGSLLGNSEPTNSRHK